MDDFVQCPSCSAWFQIIWQNDGVSYPQHCPMCGEEMDYDLEEAKAHGL